MRVPPGPGDSRFLGLLQDVAQHLVSGEAGLEFSAKNALEPVAFGHELPENLGNAGFAGPEHIGPLLAIGIVPYVLDPDITVDEVARPYDLFFLAVFFEVLGMAAADRDKGHEGDFEPEVGYPLPVVITEVVGRGQARRRNFAGKHVGDDGVGNRLGPFHELDLLVEERLRPQRRQGLRRLEAGGVFRPDRLDELFLEHSGQARRRPLDLALVDADPLGVALTDDAAEAIPLALFLLSIPGGGVPDVLEEALRG